jgi:hypothetical protein
LISGREQALGPAQDAAITFSVNETLAIPEFQDLYVVHRPQRRSLPCSDGAILIPKGYGMGPRLGARACSLPLPRPRQSAPA